jgi:hypothetical protein
MAGIQTEFGHQLHCETEFRNENPKHKVATTFDQLASSTKVVIIE